MRIGAKIMLDTGLDAARDALAGLAGSSWLILPQKESAYHFGHPAGHARPGMPGLGSAVGPVAVTFGEPPAARGSSGSLPVQWESVDRHDPLAVLLAGDIVLASAASQGHSTLALTGFCRLLPVTNGDSEQARVEFLKEVARSFITSVAVAITSSGDPGHQLQSPGPASSWVNGSGAHYCE